MNKKYIWSVIVVIIIGLIVWSMNGKSGKQAGTNQPIKIGAVISLTGFAAPWGENVRDGMNLAMKIVNESGGIDGRQVEIILEDDHTDGKDAVSAWNKLLDVDKVDGVIGGIFDFNAQPLLPLAESRKVALITPTNFRLAGTFELGPHSFAMLNDLSDVIRNFRDYLSQDKVKKVAVVHFKSAFGEEIAKTIDTVLKEISKSGIIDESYTEIGTNDFKTTVAKLKSEGVDTVFIDMLGNDPVNFLKRSREQNWKPNVLTYVGTLDAFEAVGDKSPMEGVIMVNWEIASSNFNEMFQKEYGRPALKSADMGFDSLYVMADAIAKAGNRKDVASQIANSTFKTPNGTYVFTSNHTNDNVPVEIQIVQNGTLVPWTK